MTFISPFPFKFAVQVMQTNFNQPDSDLILDITGLQLREVRLQFSLNRTAVSLCIPRQVDLPDDYDAEISNTQEQMQEACKGKNDQDHLEPWLRWSW